MINNEQKHKEKENDPNILFSSLASGSSTLIAITFQSVSPSSIMPRMPRTFTLITSPREHTYGGRV